MVLKKTSQPRTLSKMEARVVLTLEEQGRKKVSRQEIIALLGTGEKSADNVIESLRNKGWLERVSWGHYHLIPFAKGKE
jgi:predicted transcriptional regulator of viral defense system